MYIDDTLQDEEELETALKYLNKVIDTEKFVPALSYPIEEVKKCNFIKMAEGHNFIPYAEKRELNTIETTVCN